MVEPDRVVSVCRQQIQHRFAVVIPEEAAVGGEVGSVQPDRFLRTIPEDKPAVPDYDGAVFPRRNMPSDPGEIKGGSADDGVFM